MFYNKAMDDVERKEILATLYHSKKERYTDLRKFNTKKKLLQRKSAIDGLLEKVKKLKLEREFIVMKLAICYGEDLPLAMTLDRAMLQIHDVPAEEKESEEDKSGAKAACSLILLSYIMRKKSNEELKEMILESQ